MACTESTTSCDRPARIPPSSAVMLGAVMFAPQQIHDGVIRIAWLIVIRRLHLLSRRWRRRCVLIRLRCGPWIVRVVFDVHAAAVRLIGRFLSLRSGIDDWRGRWSARGPCDGDGWKGGRLSKRNCWCRTAVRKRCRWDASRTVEWVCTAICRRCIAILCRQPWHNNS